MARPNFILTPPAPRLPCSPTCRAQTSLYPQAKVEITKESTLPADAGRSTLALYNISGSVTVQGYVGTVYKLTKDATVCICKGGPDLHFKTLSRDVDVTKQSPVKNMVVVQSGVGRRLSGRRPPIVAAAASWLVVRRSPAGNSAHHPTVDHRLKYHQYFVPIIPATLFATRRPEPVAARWGPARLVSEFRKRR